MYFSLQSSCECLLHCLTFQKSVVSSKITFSLIPRTKGILSLKDVRDNIPKMLPLGLVGELAQRHPNKMLYSWYQHQERILQKEPRLTLHSHCENTAFLWHCNKDALLTVAYSVTSAKPPQNYPSVFIKDYSIHE